MRTITVEHLVPLLDTPEEVFLLDVREPSEFDEWRIPGTVNIPLGSLGARIAEVPADREVVTVCALGSRATAAAEVLEAAGIDAELLEGGMSAWATAYDEASLEVGPASVVQVRRRGKGCLSYLAGAGRSCVVIDPSLDVGQYVGRAEARGWTITHVLDTHLHADHLSGGRALAQATGATLMLNDADPWGFEFTHLEDGSTIPLDGGVQIEVRMVATPGHTMGSTCFVLGGKALFSGDTLFLESVGRPDLADRAEEFAHVLYRSLHDRVLSLPDDVVVLPAHFGDVVEVHGGELVGKPLGELRATLWQLDCDEDRFVEWAIGSVKQRPPNYVAIIEANRGGTDVDDADRMGLEAGPNRCAVAN